jgi:hypothetical protein
MPPRHVAAAVRLSDDSPDPRTGEREETTMSGEIETNLEGLKMMARMVEAIQTMRERIRELQNERDFTWNDWPYSYTVDRLMEESGVDDADEGDA